MFLTIVRFLLFGPFGTGKTETVIAMIKQLLGFDHSRVLVCAPSNSAVDKIFEVLANSMTQSELFRLYAFHRGASKPHLTQFTSYNPGTQVHDVPDLKTLMYARN
jgi:superfamily I DNA and/or RNA helicase